MAIITRAELDNFVGAREAITEMLKDAIDVPLAQVDFSSIATARDEVIDILTSFSRVGAKLASRMSAQFYDLIRERSIGQKIGATTINTVIPEAIEGFVRADISNVVKTGTTKRFVNDVKNRIAYEINRSSGNTVVYNATKDPYKVYWARVPSSGDACLFCIMLASRGAIYKSYESAGGEEHYHENCRCSIVPFFGGRLQETKNGGWIVRNSKTSIENYDPDLYYDEYIEALDDGHSGFTSRQLRKAANKAKSRV